MMWCTKKEIVIDTYDSREIDKGSRKLRKIADRYAAVIEDITKKKEKKKARIFKMAHYKPIRS